MKLRSLMIFLKYQLYVTKLLKLLTSKHLIVKINNINTRKRMFKVNKKDPRMKILTLNIFHTFF